MESKVDIDFDFCDFKPDVDYTSSKRLLQQLFHVDAPLFDIGAIVELVLSEPDVGSAIKTDGTDSDPLAIISVINMHYHRVCKSFHFRFM